METTKTSCTCIIRHVTTEADRKAAVLLLNRSRQLGDQVGTILTLASLGHCPTSKAD